MNPDYYQWLKDIIRVKGWKATPEQLINDPTYDYNIFYRLRPQEAKRMTLMPRKYHFSDIGKTVNHPTFSTESFYSGRRSVRNPKAIIGGMWGENNGRWTYTFSPSQLQNGWDVQRTIDYIIDAEDEGLELRFPNGGYPAIDGNPYLGQLPEIIVNKKMPDRN